MFRARPHVLLQQAAAELQLDAPSRTRATPAQHGRDQLVSNELDFELPFLDALFGASASQQAFDPETQLANNAYDRYLARGPEVRSSNAVQLGEQLLRLEEVLGRPHLAYLSSGSGYRELRRLIEGDGVHAFGEYVHAFIAYVKLYKPRLHARDGVDLSSFMKHEPGSLLAYQATIPYIRSPHRLDPNVLPKLENNFKDQSRSRPVVVVVMSALDFEGDLHGYAGLSRLISDSTSLVLAIEAGDQLRDVQQALQEVAATYGQDNKIQDLVVLSHEVYDHDKLADQIELAGDVSFREQSQTTSRDSLTVPQGNDPGHHVVEIERFLRQLTFLLETRWGAPAPSRLVLDIKAGRIAEPPGTKLARALRLGKDLPNFIRDLAGNYVRDNSVPGQPVLDIVVTNPNFAGNTNLVVGEDGRPTLGSNDDPAATGSKLEYVRSGMDPERVLRAIIDVWEPAWAVVEQRVEHPPKPIDAWTGDVLHALLSVALEAHRAAQTKDVLTREPKRLGSELARPRSDAAITDLARIAPAVQSLVNSRDAKGILDLIAAQLGSEISGALYRKLFANVRSSNSLPLGHGTRTELSSKTGQYEDPDPVRPQKSGPAPTPPRSRGRKK